MKVENRQQFLLIMTAVAFALLIGNSLIYEPLAKWWSSRAARIKTLQQEVTEGKGMLRRESSLHSRWAYMRANALTNNTSAAAQQVISALDNWANASGVQVGNITPSWNKDSTNYMTFNCHVPASGTLGALSQFVYQIEKGPMPLKLDSMTLAGRDDTGQTLALDLQLSGLVLIPQTP
jgi:hypothetical protein